VSRVCNTEYVIYINQFSILTLTATLTMTILFDEAGEFFNYSIVFQYRLPSSYWLKYCLPSPHSKLQGTSIENPPSANIKQNPIHLKPITREHPKCDWTSNNNDTNNVVKTELMKLMSPDLWNPMAMCWRVTSLKVSQRLRARSRRSMTCADWTSRSKTLSVKRKQQCKLSLRRVRTEVMIDSRPSSVTTA